MKADLFAQFTAARVEIGRAMQGFEASTNRIFRIGQRILASRVLDAVTQSQNDLLESSARVLDSSWLFFSLNSFYCRRQFGEFDPAAGAGLKSIHVPAGLETVPQWSDAACPSDRELIGIAQGKLNPFDSKVAPPSLCPLSVPEVSSLRIKLLQLCELVIAAAVRVRLWPRPRLALMGLYNLSPKHSTGRLFGMLFKRGMLFGEYFPCRKRLDALSFDQRRVLSEELAAVLKLEAAALTMDESEAKALAAYLALGMPLSHFEGRKSHWFAADRHVSVMGSACHAVTAIGIFYSTFHCYLLAQIRQRGGALIGVQHGGYYGYMKNHAYVESVEMQGYDRFLTWGWDRPIRSEREYRAKLEPLGSHYLRDLATQAQHESKSKAKSTIDSFALFCHTDFPRRVMRYDSPLTHQYMIEHVWPYSVEAMVSWLKSHSLGLDLKPYGGFYCEGRQSDYVRMMLAACEAADVKVRLIDSSIPARTVMGNYRVVLWDTVGTGFWESVAVGSQTFLTPAAHVFPVMGEGLVLDDAFYLDDPGSVGKSTEAQYEVARRRSDGMIQKYGKLAAVDFFTYLVSLSKVGRWRV